MFTISMISSNYCLMGYSVKINCSSAKLALCFVNVVERWLSGLMLWSDSRRVDCVLSGYIHLPNHIVLQADIVHHSKQQRVIYNGKTVGGLTVHCVMHSQHQIIASWHNLSFKNTVKYIERSDSRRVDCVLCRCIHHTISLQADIVYPSKTTCWIVRQ